MCNVSFLFIEYHNLHAKMSSYGLPSNDSAKDGHMLAYQIVGGKIKSLMDLWPTCRLRIHWRNFWSACGDPARYAWMGSQQATGVAKSNASNKAKSGTRRRGRRGRVKRGR